MAAANLLPTPCVGQISQRIEIQGHLGMMSNGLLSYDIQMSVKADARPLMKRVRQKILWGERCQILLLLVV